MRYIIILSLSLLNHQLFTHGFGQNTSITLANNTYQSINNLCTELLATKSHPYILTYNEKIQKYTPEKIKSIGVSKANCYFTIGFNEYNLSVDIACTPDQEFYLPTINKWIPAYQLSIGDKLLSKNNELLSIHHIEFIQQPLEVFIIEIKETHNFFVSRYSVLTHNMNLPLHLFAGASIPFGGIAGGSVGSFFGPITLVGGVALGALVGIIVKIFRDDKIPGYKLSTYDTHYINNYRNTSIHYHDKNKTQLPKIPTIEDGYEPPKNWDGQKARHPKNGTIGWPDKDGNIWVPVGTRGHGGPHWDVQSQKGKTYKNVFPGGKIRPGKK